MFTKRMLAMGMTACLLSAAALLPPAILLPTAAIAADPLRIGLFGPMSGERSALGTRFREAAVMYADEVNEAGGIDGRQLEIQAEDSRGQPREAANIAQKFAQDPTVLAVIGGQTSTESMAAAPILSDAGLTQVSPTASHPDYSTMSDYQFRISNTQATISQVHADMLVGTLGFKRIAIIYFQDDWGAYVNSSTTERVVDMGAEVVLAEAMVPEGRDYRALVTKVLAAEPDGIFLASHYAESAVFVQQLRQAAPDMPIAATDTLNDPKFIELAGAAADGVVMPTPFLPSAAEAAAFSEAYQARFDKVPDYYSAFAYDAVMVIAEAMKEVAASGGEITRAAVRDAIAGAEARAGVSGRIHYDANGDPEMREMSLITIEGGKYTAYPPS
ncbi:MAG: ABC transporter substrate-binding protein [Alphaproteobacteria bacterium]